MLKRSKILEANMMTDKDALKRGEQTLKERIEHKESEERDRLREKLQEKFAEMSRLLAVSRDNAQKLSESFTRLKEAINQ